MKCEYFECNKKATVNFLDLVRLCKKHYLIVLSDLNPKKRVGRPRKIQMSRILRWLEKQTFITLSKFTRDFNVTYPTASYYLRLLERCGFLKREGKVWKVMKEGGGY